MSRKGEQNIKMTRGCKTTPPSGTFLGAFMNKIVCLLVTAFCFTLTGCKGKENTPTVVKQGEQKAARPVVEKEKALAFLHGMQSGDKVKMYEAANLTPDIVNDSREKLVNAAKYKQTDQQRKDSDHALRISGEIDFLSKKMQKILPKSATLELVTAEDKGIVDDAMKAVHVVKVTYPVKQDAFTDKTNKAVKEITLRLLQLTRTLNGRQVHEFSFDSKDFEKMADKDFEVVSYY
jgi:hypothetical protein